MVCQQKKVTWFSIIILFHFRPNMWHICNLFYIIYIYTPVIEGLSGRSSYYYYFFIFFLCVSAIYSLAPWHSTHTEYYWYYTYFGITATPSVAAATAADNSPEHESAHTKLLTHWCVEWWLDNVVYIVALCWITRGTMERQSAVIPSGFRQIHLQRYFLFLLIIYCTFHGRCVMMKNTELHTFATNTHSFLC